MGRRITILGMGQTGLVTRLAPHLLRGTEVWGMNDGMRCHRGTQFARWFELHGAKYLEQWPNCKRFGGFVEYCNAIERLSLPTYVLDKLPLISNQEQYPQNEIAKHFALNHLDGTPSRMLALACYEHDALGQKVDYIQSFGIDMRDPQHAPQRPAWATWLTVAHALGIEVGGTAWDFASGTETDAGIAVDRTETAKIMQAEMVREGGNSDIVIATHYTAGDKYEAGAERLASECEQLGIEFFDRNLGVVPEGTTGHRFANRQMPQTMRGAIAKHRKPVLWVDADDQLLERPTLPHGDGWALGVLRRNPEKLAKKLPLGPYFAINATEQGLNALDDIERLCETVNKHRALCGHVAMFDGIRGAGIVDIDEYISGCIQMNPSRARKTTAIT